MQGLAEYRRMGTKYCSSSPTSCLPFPVQGKPVLRPHRHQPLAAAPPVGYNGIFPMRRIVLGLGHGCLQIQPLHTLNFLMDAGQPYNVRGVPGVPAILSCSAAVIALPTAIAGPFQLSALAFLLDINGSYLC